MKYVFSTLTQKFGDLCFAWVMHWSDLTMLATFDENGQAKMVGCGAKRLRTEYEARRRFSNMVW